MVEIGVDIKHAADLLNSGNVIGIPTETVYGLAANAFNSDALTKIFTIKERPSFDPLIVHTANVEIITSFVTSIPQQAYDMAENLWPGPLTILLPKRSIIPDLVTSGLPQVAIRIPNHPMTLLLLNALDFPLAAPSANPFGYISPTKADHVAQQLGEKIPYIIDGGTCQVGIESTIVGFENDKPIIYRLGGITLASIEKIVGKVDVMTHSSSNPATPGTLKSHYSPSKKVIIGNIQKLIDTHNRDKIAILSFQDSFKGVAEEHQLKLTANGSLKEAAQNLFSSLRHLDSLPIDIIITELVPNHQLGLAINDRLKRAAAK